MATLVDFGLMKNFAPIFSFLFVYVVSYGILTKSKWVDNQGINALISFVLAALTLMFKPAVVMINFAAPWFVVFMILGLMVLLLLLTLGVKMGDIETTVKSASVVWTILIIGIIILLFALGEAAQQSAADGDDPDAITSNYQRIKPVLYNPNIMGVILLLIVAGFAITFLSTTK
ncbi:hypothetical protein KY321_00890 [Candidatus Woesearchaeota archaeon]|nr:hypothetical protein [Candidatus Woesearchaeota archaeon]